MLVTGPDGQLRGTGQTLPDGEGRFRFDDVEPVEGGSYVLSVDYGGVFYGATLDLGELANDLALTVYESTQDVGVLAVERQVMVISDADEGERMASATEFVPAGQQLRPHPATRPHHAGGNQLPEIRPAAQRRRPDGAVGPARRRGNLHRHRVRADRAGAAGRAQRRLLLHLPLSVRQPILPPEPSPRRGHIPSARAPKLERCRGGQSRPRRAGGHTRHDLYGVGAPEHTARPGSAVGSRRTAAAGDLEQAWRGSGRRRVLAGGHPQRLGRVAGRPVGLGLGPALPARRPPQALCPTKGWRKLRAKLRDILRERVRGLPTAVPWCRRWRRWTGSTSPARSRRAITASNASGWWRGALGEPGPDSGGEG